MKKSIIIIACIFMYNTVHASSTVRALRNSAAMRIIARRSALLQNNCVVCNLHQKDIFYERSHPGLFIPKELNIAPFIEKKRYFNEDYSFNYRTLQHNINTYSVILDQVRYASNNHALENVTRNIIETLYNETRRLNNIHTRLHNYSYTQNAEEIRAYAPFKYIAEQYEISKAKQLYKDLFEE